VHPLLPTPIIVLGSGSVNIGKHVLAAVLAERRWERNVQSGTESLEIWGRDVYTQDILPESPGSLCPSDNETDVRVGSVISIVRHEQEDGNSLEKFVKAAAYE
jgi:hypothetical protein